MTPYKVCESRYDGEFSAWLANKSSLIDCIVWARSHGIHEHDAANKTCSESTLTAFGSTIMARRMREVTTAHNLSLLDAFNITDELPAAQRCKHTTDGRHYDSLQPTVAKLLVGF